MKRDNLGNVRLTSIFSVVPAIYLILGQSPTPKVGAQTNSIHTASNYIELQLTDTSTDYLNYEK